MNAAGQTFFPLAPVAPPVTGSFLFSVPWGPARTAGFGLSVPSSGNSLQMMTRRENFLLLPSQRSRYLRVAPQTIWKMPGAGRMVGGDRRGMFSGLTSSALGLSERGRVMMSSMQFVGNIDEGGKGEASGVNGVAGNRHSGQGPLTFRAATIGDAAAILRIINQNRRFDQYRQGGVAQSDEGFLLADLSLQEVATIIEQQPLVYVGISGDQVVAFVVGTTAEVNLYENLKGWSIEWHSEQCSREYRNRTHLYLWMMGVDAPFRRSGVGKKLLLLVEEKARNLGYRSLIGDVMLTPILNRASNAFFERMQYEMGGILTIADYYGSGLSSWKIWFKVLVKPVAEDSASAQKP